jgi:hypothetical protein
MIIAAILFTIMGLVFNTGAIIKSRQSTDPKNTSSNTKTSAILVSVGMANITLGMAFIALHFIG